MKKVNFLIAAALFAVSSAFVSCSDDEDIAPASITFDNVSNNSVTLSAGATTYTLNATITSEANLKSIKVSKKVGSDITQVGSEVTKFDTKTTHHLNQLISDITADCEITVTVNNGTETGKVLMIKYTPEEPVATTEINTFENVSLKPALSDGRTNSACAASIDGTVFVPYNASAANIAKCDFVYFYTTKGIIYSPNSAAAADYIGPLFTGWSVKNATLFNVLTDVDFATITASNIVEIAGTPAATSVDNVALNSVVAFKTAGGKVGVFKVTALQAGSSATEGQCTIDIKVVK